MNDYKKRWQMFDKLADLALEAIKAESHWSAAMEMDTTRMKTVYPEGLGELGKRKRAAADEFWRMLYGMKYALAMAENKIDAE
jgi:hypothetical protein